MDSSGHGQPGFEPVSPDTHMSGVSGAGPAGSGSASTVGTHAVLGTLFPPLLGHVDVISGFPTVSVGR